MRPEMQLFQIVQRADGRLSYEPVSRRRTWREHALDVAAAVGVAAGLYLVALAVVWHF